MCNGRWWSAGAVCNDQRLAAPGSSQTFTASPVTGSYISVMVRVTILAGTSLAAGSVVN